MAIVDRAMIQRKAQALCLAQQGTSLLWAPLMLLAGIWLYFALWWEPHKAFAYLCGLAALFLGGLGRHKLSFRLVALFFLGFALAQCRSWMIATPLIQDVEGNRHILAVVEKYEQTPKKQIILIVAPRYIAGFTPAELPSKLKLAATESKIPNPDLLEPGTKLAFQATLRPLPRPVIPQGFEYGRSLYFEEIGGLGTIRNQVTKVGFERDIGLWFEGQLFQIRRLINKRITHTLSGNVGAVAQAIITGERTQIPEYVNQSLQISGLAHILSISGLHMALAAGGVFWVFRALMALWPYLALHYPIKKIAAAVALIFGLFYMLLADGGAATIRSYIMLAIMFIAILLDRPAFSLRNVALAAIIILVFTPEAGLQAGFQLSFMAVLGLTAFALSWARWQKKYNLRQRFFSGLKGRALHFITLAFLTSLIAGVLTFIPSIYHFGRLAPYSILANGLAVSFMSFCVMPAALLSVALMPLGLEAWPLTVMGWGLEAVLYISNEVAILKGAKALLPQPPVFTAMVMAFGFIFFCLTKGALRLLAGVFLGFGLLSLLWRQPPDILVEQLGRNIAIRNENGELVIAQMNTGRFAVEKWLTINGEDITVKTAFQRKGWLCEQGYCWAEVKGTKLLYFTEEKGLNTKLCAVADVVIAPFMLPPQCVARHYRFDLYDFWQQGALAFFLSPQSIKVVSAQKAVGDRPWRIIPRISRGMIANSPTDD